MPSEKQKAYTLTQSGQLSFQGLSIGVMVFILHKPYFLSPYT